MHTVDMHACARPSGAATDKWSTVIWFKKTETKNTLINNNMYTEEPHSRVRESTYKTGVKTLPDMG